MSISSTSTSTAVRSLADLAETEAVIVDAVRTPIGRYGGALAHVRADDLAAIVLRAIIERTGLDAQTIDDVILGCTNQSGEDSRNVARMSALLAGYPVDVPGQTVNRLCGSGLQAIASAAHAIKAGEGDCFVAGGVENMTRAPLITLKAESAFPRGVPETADSTIGWRFTNPTFPSERTISMGETAEVVAQRYHISRDDQDQFALESQQKTAVAMQSGRFADELVEVTTSNKKNQTTSVAHDEHPRPQTTLEALRALRPAFTTDKNGTVTAGTSSGINDGAAATLIMSAARARAEHRAPFARIVASAVAGVAPDVMGIGPVPAVRKVLHRGGVSIQDIDLIELNEAFAAQALACIRELHMPAERVNVNGGAIALGHPLGSSGARIVTTLVHEMRKRAVRYGLATMCIGVGQGIAMLFERIT